MLRDRLEGLRDEVVKGCRCGRESGRGELLGRKLGLESFERRARREAVRGWELLVTECEGEHRRRLLALARLAEQRADAAQREQLERDRGRGVCALERLAERPLRLVDVAERQRGESRSGRGQRSCPTCG